MTTEKLRHSRGLGHLGQRPVPHKRDQATALAEIASGAARYATRLRLCTQTYGFLGFLLVSRTDCIRLLAVAHCPREYPFWHTGALAHETEG